MFLIKSDKTIFALRRKICNDRPNCDNSESNVVKRPIYKDHFYNYKLTQNI
jgi:hypothetical protein